MKAANRVTKGKAAEREIATKLNDIHYLVHKRLFPDREIADPFQRRQNQSAVGGSDIENPYGLCIEVKHCKDLSINTWWKQCLNAAQAEKGWPILIYKQNQRAWRVQMYGLLQVAKPDFHAVVNIDIDTFENWLIELLTLCLQEKG